MSRPRLRRDIRAPTLRLRYLCSLIIYDTPPVFDFRAHLSVASVVDRVDDKAIDMFKDTKSLIVTTKSHQVDKKGLVTDRFRVILYIGISIIDMEYYSKLMKIDKPFHLKYLE